MIDLQTFHAMARECPELALLGAVIHVAIADARDGNQEAHAWLHSNTCLSILLHLTPPGMDPDNVQERLTATLESGE